MVVMVFAPLARQLEPEIMDDPTLEEQQHLKALQGLERINRWSRSLQIVWPALAALCREHPDQTIQVLDVATGGGDIPLGIHQRAQQLGLKIKVRGCDLSPRAVEYSQARAKTIGVTGGLEYFQLDVFNQNFPADVDVLMCSLFLHHLDAEHAQTLLSKMAQHARKLVLINDLVRSRTGVMLAHAATRLLTTSPVVHADGPQSVRAAFTLNEIKSMAAGAGLSGFTLEKRWPCRFLLQWKPRSSNE